MKSYHWADVYAEAIIRDQGNKEKYILESGITPSGTIHAGNFREVITADLIKRALIDKKKKVKFLYAWDDYDVLRKVPKNLPKQKLIEKNLRTPVFRVPDPFNCHKSYAEHFEKAFEEESEKIGIEAEYIYQHKYYLKCKYAKEIKTALEKKDKIIKILNKFRKEPLKDSWLPIFVFCEKCNKDTTTNTWNGDYSITYSCKCGHRDTIDFRKKGIVTLRWRVDWPMRWHYNKVNFESAGKDHFAAGGSIDTGYAIQKEAYNSKHPFGFPYEWISIKGKGQFASSKGEVITISEALEIYEPEIIRYLFAGTRPNKEFSLSFDLDVLKIYEDYSKCERIYFKEGITSEKETSKQKRIYELSQINTIAKNLPIQTSIRHLTTILQINNLNISKTIEHFGKQNKFNTERLKIRANCAKNWLEKYAPEEFKFQIQEKPTIKLNKIQKELIQEIIKTLKEELTDQELHQEFYKLIEKHNTNTKDFFQLMYKILINKEKGPKLASFILTIGKEKVNKLLSRF